MDSFFNKVICASGEEIHVAGLCKINTGIENLNKSDKLKNLSFNKNDDAYDVDYKIAVSIRENFGKDVYAVGASVKVEHIINLSSGGVIGSPNEPIKSAGGEIEYIENGLYMTAFDESPGVVAQCSENIIKIISKIILINKNDRKKCIDRILDCLDQNNIKYYLIVQDGSGRQNIPRVICKAGE